MALTAQIVATEVDDTEDDEVRAGRATERDETQVLLDTLTGELADAWRATGDDDTKRTSLEVLRTKAGFKRAAKRSVTVAADDRTEAKRMIRRACVLHKVTPVYANDKTNEDGTIRIKWTVGPFVARVRKPKATEDGQAAPSAPETPADASPPSDSAGVQDTENPGTGDTPTPDAETADTGRKWGKR